METINYKRLMAKKVTAMLKPYGIKRFRRTEDDLFFIDDQGWFTSIFDFKLHEGKCEKSVSVSSGIDFNWNLNPILGFNFSDSSGDFLEFTDEKQFSENLIKLCMETIKKTLEYRNNLMNIKTAEQFILKHKFGIGTTWTNYNRGLISGLAGNLENLNKYFDKILDMNEKNNRLFYEQEIIEIKKNVLELKNIANKDTNKFTKKIVDIVNKTRELNELDKMKINIK